MITGVGGLFNSLMSLFLVSPDRLTENVSAVRICEHASTSSEQKMKIGEITGKQPIIISKGITH